MHRHYSTHRNGGDNDRHGLPRLRGTVEKIEAGMLSECPVCDGRGWTWEQDLESGAGVPCPCPIGEQMPEWHRRDG